MQSWRNISAQLPTVDVSAVSKNFRNTVQLTRCVDSSFRRIFADACLTFITSLPSMKSTVLISFFYLAVFWMCEPLTGRDWATSDLMGSPSASLIMPKLLTDQLTSSSSLSPIFSASRHDRLPAEYKQLEARVDALKDTHQRILKITKVHETESVSCRSICRTVYRFGHPLYPIAPRWEDGSKLILRLAVRLPNRYHRER